MLSADKAGNTNYWNLHLETVTEVKWLAQGYTDSKY